MPCSITFLSRQTRALLSVLFLLVASFNAFAQDQITVYGTVFDHFTRKKLDGAVVTVYKNGGKLQEVKTNASGKYELSLDYAAEYKIVYSCPTYVGKTIIVNGNNIPEEERLGGHGLDCEANLIPELKGVDYTPLQQPFVIFKFNAAEDNIVADVDHLMSMKDVQARIIAEYEKIKKAAANAEEDFKKRMVEGEAAMTAADYKKAVELFTAALALKAGDAKATARLSDAKMKFDDQEAWRKKNEVYANLIKEGDALFVKKDYAAAKAKFEAATAEKFDEAYPRTKAKECEALIAEAAKKAEEERKAKELEEKYKAAITAADAAFKLEKYEEAKGKYTEASGLKAAEQYPKDQLAACAKKIEELAKKAEEEKRRKEIEAKYTAAIAAADAAFKAGNFEPAKGKYEEALAVKPEEKYPKDQITACVKGMEEQAMKAEEEKKLKELDAKYKAAIAAADASFKAERFDDSKTRYNEALGLKPAEKYPKDQLAAIEKRIAELAKKAEEEKKQKELNDQYNAAIAAADEAFRAKGWDEAKKNYNAALALKAAEKYPKDQLAAIDKAIADEARKAEEEKKQAEINARYEKIIATADDMFKSENYDGARAKYTEASTLKSEEAYPKGKIKEIDALIAEQKRKEEEERRKAELDKRYNDLVAVADKAYDARKYPDAINAYKDASGLKPEEAHPKQRISEIEKLLDDAAREKAEKDRLAQIEKEKEQRYNDLLAKADADFSAKKYAEARASYVDASAIEPDEKKPAQRITEIDKLLAELADQAEQDRLKAEADAAERARLEAERLKERQDKEAVEGRYRELVAAGDLAFNAESFDEARSKYTDALAVKPDEQYPKDRLAQIEERIAQLEKAKADAELAADDERRRMEEQKAIDERYRLMIIEADSTMSAEAYTDARALYTLALDVKPQEVWPQSQIERIDLILAEQERKRREAELAAQKEPEPEPKQQNRRVDRSQEQQAEDFMREAREREERDKYERIKKLKAEVLAETEKDEQAADGRRTASVEGNQQLAGQGASIYEGSQDGRQANLDAVEAQKQALIETEQERIERSRAARMDAYSDKLGTEEQQQRTTVTWDDRHDARVDAAIDEAGAETQRQEDRAENAADRRDQALEQNAAVKGDLLAMDERGDQRAEEGAGRMQDEKEAVQRRQASVANSADDRRANAKEQVDRTPVNQPRDFADYNRSSLAQRYPQGVTEESYTEGNKVIIKRIVVQGNKADEYSKVIAKWGTFYFRNGQSITEQIWLAATEE